MEQLNSDGDISIIKKNLSRMKIAIGLLVLGLVICIIVIIVLASQSDGRWDSISNKSIIEPTLEMAFNGTITNDSPAYYNRSCDVNKSPYHPILNFYDGHITDTLRILPKFQTYQQTSMFTCGCASAFMALRYLGINDITENDIGIKAESSYETGTITSKLDAALTELAGEKINVVSTKGVDVSFEEFIEMVKECTNPDNKCVLLLANMEWGGHWMTLIGYDNMGTDQTGDDILIFAEPFDIADHNQDGYYITSLEKYFYTWFVELLPPGEKNKPFVKISLKT